jgi:hypothetical protein
VAVTFISHGAGLVERIDRPLGHHCFEPCHPDRVFSVDWGSSHGDRPRGMWRPARGRSPLGSNDGGSKPSGRSKATGRGDDLGAWEAIDMGPTMCRPDKTQNTTAAGGRTATASAIRFPISGATPKSSGVVRVRVSSWHLGGRQFPCQPHHMAKPPGCRNVVYPSLVLGLNLRKGGWLLCRDAHTARVLLIEHRFLQRHQILGSSDDSLREGRPIVL